MSRSLLAALLVATLAVSSGCATQKISKPGEIAPVVARHTRSTEIDLVPVKGGCYRMGDQFGIGRNDEFPVHEVCLSDFSIGKYEVTQAQWQAVMGQNPSSFNQCGPDCPVENVSWLQVQGFIKKLNALTNKNYRLPTEAEWEYAARSGGNKDQWAGVSVLADLKDYAWYEDNSEAKTHPVGEKKPNALGIYDMTGNVWEWCQDIHGDDYYKNSPKENPTGPVKGMHRATRGGSFSSAAWNLRAADRGMVLQSHHNNALGFRLVLPASK